MKIGLSLNISSPWSSFDIFSFSLCAEERIRITIMQIMERVTGTVEIATTTMGATIMKAATMAVVAVAVAVAATTTRTIMVTATMAVTSMDMEMMMDHTPMMNNNNKTFT